ncbi:hypothetical protein OIU34_39000 [Pararhizobium sp. BT-229]|uniref:hypothetical protein n=1 Tax=Pararhizobium sp. BT-229 TaxID=2986923 RepID=UPI0021F6D596|nr:hypothetical protein [Pararhizobium sp. BT-229]MCV9967799.1 hypothetical protein [Pararhizobium sp. BT-229]
MTKASEAVLNLLRKIKAVPEKSIDMFAIGTPLALEHGFNQYEIVTALYRLRSEGVIELIGGNRLRLIKRLPDAASPV